MRKIVVSVCVVCVVLLALFSHGAADVKPMAVSIMSVTPIDNEVSPGENATYDVKMRSISELGAPMENVTLAVEDAKPGWTYSFDPVAFFINATETKHSIMCMTVSPDATPGDYYHTINASVYLAGYEFLGETSNTSFVNVKTTVIPICLGTCCSDENCTQRNMENVTCRDCIEIGKHWKPNKDAACFDGEAPFDLCLNWCPQCCDGIENDAIPDGIDLRDPECTCGLDPSEAEKLPPVPEVPTCILVCIGLLALLLLVRMRMVE